MKAVRYIFVHRLILLLHESGTSKACSELLAKDFEKRCGVKSRSVNLFEYEKYWPDVVLGKFPLIGFVVSSYGAGSPTKNAGMFFDYIESSKEDFGKINFFLFGNGNSYFNTFQGMGRNTTALMKERGSHLVFERGVGDSANDAAGDFKKWRDRFFPFIVEQGIFNGIAKEDQKRPKIIIFFGSMGGNSKGFASSLCHDAKTKYGFDAEVVDLQNYTDFWSMVKEGKYPIVVLITSSFGAGGPTMNAREFHEYLTSTKDDFSKIHFIVFANGNRTFPTYNGMGKRVNRLMEQLGGHRMFEMGLGDASEGAEGDMFKAWREKLLPFLAEKFETNTAMMVDEDDGEGSLTVTFSQKLADGEDEETAQQPYIPPASVKDSPSIDHPRPVMLTVRKELYLNVKNRSALFVEFDLTDSAMSYRAGDHLAIQPSNAREIIMAYAKRLGVEAKLQQYVTIVNEDGEGFFAKKTTTLWNVFAFYLYLTVRPPRSKLELLAKYCKDEEERKKLEFLVSDEGKEKYEQYIRKDGRRILDILEEFKSIDIPLPVFLEFMPRLLNRYYSIASTQKTDTNIVQLIVSVVNYKTANGRLGHGVSSNYLARAWVGSQAWCWTVSSQYWLPESMTVPVILVGNGSGYAPLRGFLLERDYLQKQGEKLGTCLLFFGCRNRANDWLMSEEMMELEKSGVITKLYLAFSRDQKKKVYVQHLIADNFAEVGKLLDGNAHLYMCGTTSMSESVKKTVYEGMVKLKVSGVDAIDAAKRKIADRVFEEVWDNTSN